MPGSSEHNLKMRRPALKNLIFRHGRRGNWSSNIVFGMMHLVYIIFFFYLVLFKTNVTFYSLVYFFCFLLAHNFDLFSSKIVDVFSSVGIP